MLKSKKYNCMILVQLNQMIANVPGAETVAFLELFPCPVTSWFV